MALPSIAELRKLLDNKIARDHIERMRKELLRRRAGGYVAPPDRVELGTIPAGTVVDTSFFTHGLNRAFHLSAAGGEVDKDWTYDLQMVQHALVSRDRAVVTLPVFRLPSGVFWAIAPTLEAAFVARYDSPAYVVHDKWEYGHTDGRIQVPLWQDQYVDQRLPRVVPDTVEAHRWARVVVITGGSGSHFTVEDLP